MEKTLRRFLICTVLVTFAFCSSVRLFAADDKPAADVLVFKNGDKLTGHFERSDGANAVFKSDMAGELTIAWDKIAELQTSGNYAVLKKGAPLKAKQLGAVPEGTLTMKDQTITLASGSAAPTTISTKDAAYIVDEDAFHKARSGGSFWQEWNGTVTAGATIVRATQDAQTLAGALNLARSAPGVPWLAPHNRTLVDFLGSYGKQSQPGTPDIKTAIYHADGEQDFYLSPRLYALANAAFDHNFSQGLDLQQIYGGGLGYTVVKTPAQELDVKAQAQFETQAFGIVPGTTDTTTMASTKLFGATFAENYMRKWKAVTVSQQLELIPAFNITQDYSGIASLGAAVPLYKRLSINMNATDNYLNDAAPGARKNSFQFVTGISYKLK